MISAVAVLLLFFGAILIAPKKNGAQILTLFVVVLVGPRYALDSFYLGKRPIEIRAEDLFLIYNILIFAFRGLTLKTIPKPIPFLSFQATFVGFLVFLSLISLCFSSSYIPLIYLLPMIKGILLGYFCCGKFSISSTPRNIFLSIGAITVLLCCYLIYQELSGDYCGEKLFSYLLGTQVFHQISAAWSGKIDLGRSNLPFEREPAISGFAILLLYSISRQYLSKFDFLKKSPFEVLFWALTFTAILFTKSRSALIVVIALPLLTSILNRYTLSLFIFSSFAVGSIFGSKTISILLPSFQKFFSFFPISYDTGLESLKIRNELIGTQLSFDTIPQALLGKPALDLIFDNQFTAFFSLFGFLGFAAFIIVQLKTFSSLYLRRIDEKVMLDIFYILSFASLTIEPFRSFRIFPAFIVYAVYAHLHNRAKNLSQQVKE